MTSLCTTLPLACTIPSVFLLFLLPRELLGQWKRKKAVHEICCPGFNWDRVDFLPSIEVWIEVETTFYYTLVFVAK